MPKWKIQPDLRLYETSIDNISETVQDTKDGKEKVCRCSIRKVPYYVHDCVLGLFRDSKPDIATNADAFCLITKQGVSHLTHILEEYFIPTRKINKLSSKLQYSLGLPSGTKKTAWDYDLTKVDQDVFKTYPTRISYYKWIAGQIEDIETRYYLSKSSIMWLAFCYAIDSSRKTFALRGLTGQNGENTILLGKLEKRLRDFNTANLTLFEYYLKAGLWQLVQTSNSALCREVLDFLNDISSMDFSNLNLFKEILSEYPDLPPIRKEYAKTTFHAYTSLYKEYLKSGDMEMSETLKNESDDILIADWESIKKGISIEVALNMETVSKFFDFLFPKLTGFVDVRAISNGGKPIQQFYDNKEDFIDFVEKHNEKYNLYVGLNQRKRERGRKEDVASVNTILVDVDPIREKGEASTDEELYDARARARIIMDKMMSLGYERPVMAMSGNGYHLYFCIPEIKLNSSNRDEVEDKIKVFFKYLAERYSDDKVKVDSTWDLPRIVKIIGTKSIKGRDTKDRPFRYSTLEEDIVRREDERLLKDLNDCLTAQKEDSFERLPPYIKPDGSKFKKVCEVSQIIKDLFEGRWQTYNYASRSEAEMALCSMLARKGFSRLDVRNIMRRSKIGKWKEKPESYRKVTLDKAFGVK